MHHCSDSAPPRRLALAGYVNYLVMFIVSWIREFIYGPGPLRGQHAERFKDKSPSGYAPLFDGFESFYIRNVFRRQKDVFSCPIASVPGATVKIRKRVSDNDFWSFQMVDGDDFKECINMASYNYLGFAQNDGECVEKAIQAARKFGLSCCSSRHQVGGSLDIHHQLEQTVAQFVGAEDAMVFGMGFATNSLNLPVILCKGCLVLSDELNHASLILGIRLSGARVAVFKHNDMQDLERLLRQAVINGQPGTKKPWKKLFIVVEGIYSMEGTIVNLPHIVALKKKYKAYLYLDEAHSVGAMGDRGRGVIDYFHVDPKDVDFIMGTLTKSFGSAGGYIAGTASLIHHLRKHSQAFCYGSSMSAAVAAQVITAMKAIMDGSQLHRVAQLAANTRYFRHKLVQMGFRILGHPDSPVVPLMLFMPSKVQPFLRRCQKMGLSTVGVGFPATKMTLERARFCVSASHSRHMLDKALHIISFVGEDLHLKYDRRKTSV